VLYDLSGRLVATATHSGHLKNLRHCSPGVYVAKVADKNARENTGGGEGNSHRVY
jgi:hypothetical protein